MMPFPAYRVELIDNISCRRYAQIFNAFPAAIGATFLKQFLFTGLSPPTRCSWRQVEAKYWSKREERAFDKHARTPPM